MLFAIDQSTTIDESFFWSVFCFVALAVAVCVFLLLAAMLYSFKDEEKNWNELFQHELLYVGLGCVLATPFHAIPWWCMLAWIDAREDQYTGIFGIIQWSFVLCNCLVLWAFFERISILDHFPVVHERTGEPQRPFLTPVLRALIITSMLGLVFFNPIICSMATCSDDF